MSLIFSECDRFISFNIPIQHITRSTNHRRRVGSWQHHKSRRVTFSLYSNFTSPSQLTALILFFKRKKWTKYGNSFKQLLSSFESKLSTPRKSWIAQVWNCAYFVNNTFLYVRFYFRSYLVYLKCNFLWYSLAFCVLWCLDSFSNRIFSNPTSWAATSGSQQQLLSLFFAFVATFLI